MIPREGSYNSLSLPRFSVIIETENLAATAADGLLLSLESLHRQDLSITGAEEVILLDSGDAPIQLIRTIEDRYRWLRVVRSETDVGYYEAKTAGVESTSGDIVIFADSDCVYSPNWLRSMVEAFLNEAVLIVGGETMVSGAGPYALANHFVFFFDGFSLQRRLYRSSTYYANNLACRRTLLDQYPFPIGLPFYRGTCAIHRNELVRNGITIWRQPGARASHAPPSLSSFAWRYLLIGRDKALIKTYLRDSGASLRKSSILEKLIARFKCVLTYRPLSLVWLPIAMPMGAVAASLVFVGNVVTKNRIDFLIGLHHRLESKATEV